MNAGLCISPPSSLVLSMRRDEMCFPTIIVHYPSNNWMKYAASKCSKTAWILSAKGSSRSYNMMKRVLENRVDVCSFVRS
jgi:hypothetical protein